MRKRKKSSLEDLQRALADKTLLSPNRINLKSGSFLRLAIQDQQWKDPDWQLWLCSRRLFERFKLLLASAHRSFYRPVEIPEVGLDNFLGEVLNFLYCNCISLRQNFFQLFAHFFFKFAQLQARENGILKAAG